jgi:hypothetical protein
MADRGGERVLEIRRGVSGKGMLVLTPGVKVSPMSIGLRGDWRIEADGMRDVSGYVYFDGESLFVQASEDRRDMRVNGAPVGTSWMALTAPCTVAIGDARLMFCDVSEASTAPNVRPAAGRPSAHTTGPPTSDLDDEPTKSMSLVDYPDAGPDDRTGDIPLPPAYQPPSGDEETSVLPLPELPAAAFTWPNAPAPPKPIETAPPVAPTTPPVVIAPSFAPPPMPDAMNKTVKITRAASAAPGKPSVGSEIKAQWKAASGPKKAILLLLPVAFVFVIYGFQDDEAPTRTRTRSSSSAASASETETIASVEPPKVIPPTPTSLPSIPAPSASTPRTDGKRTLERAAVDAVVAGAYDQAAKMYAELAEAHPDNGAYREAARILRAKSTPRK